MNVLKCWMIRFESIQFRYGVKSDCIRNIETLNKNSLTCRHFWYPSIFNDQLHNCHIFVDLTLRITRSVRYAYAYALQESYYFSGKKIHKYSNMRQFTKKDHMMHYTVKKLLLPLKSENFFWKNLFFPFYIKSSHRHTTQQMQMLHHETLTVWHSISENFRHISSEKHKTFNRTFIVYIFINLRNTYEVPELSIQVDRRTKIVT